MRTVCGLILLAAAAAVAAEPICWTVGGWDDTGAPKGALLTDNPGWWGERVWTGVSYTYEIAPTSPAVRARRRHEVAVGS